MLIGCLILFNDECKCLAGIVSAGLSSLAAGGSIYTGQISRIHANNPTSTGVHRLVLSYIHLLCSLHSVSRAPPLVHLYSEVADAAPIVP